MTAMDREVIDTADINDASDMVAAIESFEETVAAEKGYLSFLYMSKQDKNVDKARLIKIELTDGSFVYEIELV